MRNAWAGRAGRGALAVAGFVMALAMLAQAGEPATIERAATRPPNIIVILADDLGYGDLSVNGQKHFATPRIDQMAARGLRFTNHYAGSTVCAPSRAALLTGNHTGHLWQRGNGKVAFRRGEHDITIAQRLKALGYHTAMIGKSGVACNSDDATLPNDKGFDHFFGYLGHADAHRQYPRQLVRNGEVVVYDDNDGRHGAQYGGELIMDETLRYLEQRAAADAPFFLHVSMTQPHADLAVPESFREPFLESFEEKAFPGGHYTAQSHPKAAYAAMVTYVDHNVGRILDKLAELGIAEDTLVLFSSDNGPHKEGGYHWDMHNSNGPFRGGKRDFYDGGIRVPLIAYWPGVIEPGRTSDHLSAFWDFAPTALELAGQAPPDTMDGISYVPTLLGRGEQREHAYLYWEFYEQGGRRAVRWGDWKLIELNLSKPEGSTLELYNLSNDPGERRNVAAEHGDIVDRMQAMMTESHEPSEIFRW